MQDQTPPKLELFYFDACPFCQVVLNVIKQLDLKVELLNIQEDPQDFNRLVQDTGRKTVPCLYVDNRPMFESADIIDWLQKNSEHLEKKS